MKAIHLPEPFFFEAGPRAVLLLHAYTGSANDVRLLGRFLERNGYTVYAPNFTGHATDRFEDILDLGGPDIWFADAMRAKAELMEKGYDQLAVFGLSMGGIMATRAIETGGFIGGGSFNSPIISFEDSRVPISFMHFAKLSKKKLGMANLEIEHELALMKPKLNAQLAQLDEFTELIKANLADITVPYYIAQSGKDEMISADCGKLLADRLVNAEGDYHFFSEATHVITVGKDRNVFEETVLAFLNRLYWNEG